jgi:hypothetical protein
MRDKAYIKACLEEAIRWIDENDSLPDRKIDMGVWFSNLMESEILSFVEHPKYAGDYMDEDPENVHPYQLIIIPLNKEDFEDCYTDEE